MQWSLGVILYELFAGEPPFYTNDIVTLVKKISDDPLVLPDGCSDMFKDFLKRLLRKEPKERYIRLMLCRKALRVIHF